MALKSGLIALNASTPTPLLVKGASAGQFNNINGTIQDPLPVIIQNADASIVIYVGGPTVTALTGFPVAAGASLPMNLYGESEIPYAIAASATPKAAVLVGRQ